MERSESGEEAVASFAVRLKALRERAGLTQQQLAEASGLHLGAVFKLEQGRREPSWATVQALAAALGVDCTAFAIEPKDAPAPQRGRPRKADAGPVEDKPAATVKRKRKPK